VPSVRRHVKQPCTTRKKRPLKGNGTWVCYKLLGPICDATCSYIFIKINYCICSLKTNIYACKFWGFHGSDYKECRLLGYKNPVRTSQQTHYISTIESSQLMQCKFWGFYGGDYEECRLLGYNTPVRTSQETHYVSTTELSLLMLCKFWGFYGGDYEECRLLKY
jgi:hypothetical protein